MTTGFQKVTSRERQNQLKHVMFQQKGEMHFAGVGGVGVGMFSGGGIPDLFRKFQSFKYHDRLEVP